MQETVKAVKGIIKRFNYGLALKSMSPTNVVDHVNKVVYLTDVNDALLLSSALLNIVFWVSPNCVKHFILDKSEFPVPNKVVRNRKLGHDLFMCLHKLVHTYNPCEYKKTPVGELLHQFNNPTLKYYEGLGILASKLLDEEDCDYKARLVETNTVNGVPKEYKHIYHIICDDHDACVSGSVGLSLYGRVYRDKIKDIDFSVNTRLLGKKLNAYLDEKVTSDLKGKKRMDAEKEIRKLFEQTRLYKRIKDSEPDVTLTACVIDRCSEYDKSCKMTVTFKRGDDYEFDLIFRDTIEYEFENETKVQEINALLTAKRQLGRQRDFRDLIDFIPRQLRTPAIVSRV